MLVAEDLEGNRLYADSNGKRYTDCYCPICDKPVIHRIGRIRRSHFAHKRDVKCYFGHDKDYKSEWHIRMQEYFPPETREIKFKNKKTGEIHIADVFLKKSNTVIEFQHGPIEDKEFFDITNYHLRNNRRVVWLFNESVPNQKSDNLGRFKPDYSGWERWPYNDRCYKWLRNPRTFFKGIKNYEKYLNCLSICVYTGIEGDVFHRIIREYGGFKYVVFSLHDIEMNEEIDVEEFFKSETYWQNQKPWEKLFRLKREALLRRRYINPDLLLQ